MQFEIRTVIGGLVLGMRSNTYQMRYHRVTSGIYL